MSDDTNFFNNTNGEFKTIYLILKEVLLSEKINKLFQDFSSLVDVSITIIDLQGNVLTSSNWQRICTDFHRVNDTTCKRCIDSDTELANNLENGKDFTIYQCKNGLINCASPIIIKGHHIANLFIGQFLIKKPDLSFFQAQAKEFDFDEVKYMEALKKVPVVSEEKSKRILSYLSGFAQLVAAMSFEKYMSEEKDKIVAKKNEELIYLNNNLENKVEEKVKQIGEECELKELYFNSVNTLIVALDTNGIITMINKAGCDILGFKYGEIVGKSWFEIGVLPEDIVDDVKAYFSKIILGELKLGEESYENELKSKDGKKNIFSWSNSLLKRDGKIIGVLSSGINITTEKRQEQVILEQSRMVAMGEMIGNIAHQWRQPLSVISTAATGMQVQKEYGLLTDKLFNESCEAINKHAQYLSKTIDDFTNFIKGDLKAVKFNLKNDSDSFLKLVDATIKNHHINVVLELQEHINIKGYPNHLIQCFINIFNNAKDALVENNSEDDRYIFITQQIVDNNVIIKFKDNAGGIPDDVLPRIFEPYFTTKHKSQGTGLGLHMTYRLIVNGMKGAIKAENVSFEYNGKEYTGAEFIITLPIS
ncbi:MAG: PocR ligand-binding domain-containing protein [Arcobacteraceae bacterium]|nr:PocR ligand-binding domain-containing protein [Arcobacteraceae bacterium]